VLKLPTWLVNFLIVIVALVWAATFVAGIFVKDYQAPESINLIFSAIITTLVLGRKRGNGDDEKTKGGG